MEEITITPNKDLGRVGRDLWRYRELFFFLAWRNLLIRYKQTVLGIAWSLLRPLLTMIIFTVVFGQFAGLPAFNVPYPVLVLAALIPWQFFSNVFTESSESLLAESTLISKVYFPRIVIPTTCIVVSLTDLVISLALFSVLMVVYKIPLSPTMALLPIFILMIALLSLGVGYFFSTLNLKYRDFRYVVPFIIQIGLYLSPVGFSSRIVPEHLQLIYALNPMVGIVEGFRWALLGERYGFELNSFLISLGMTIGIFLVGFNYFIHNERKFADIL